MPQAFDNQKTRSYRPIGAYLVEAGLLTDDQVGVVLADQDVTAMPFGEIVIARGWAKEKTIEFIMEKVVLPERGIPHNPLDGMQDCLTRRQRPTSTHPPAPPPPLKEGISWIG